MIASAGSFALSVGLFGALLAVVLWARTARADWAAATSAAGPTTAPQVPVAARQATWLMFIGAATACALMEWALVTNDFSVRFVAENSSRATPLLYRITALWSALDGSLLLWLLVLAGYGLLLTRPGRSRPGGPHDPATAIETTACETTACETTAFEATARAVVAAVTFGFFAVTLAATQPFARLAPAPNDGPGPNPLLADHPAMAIHPPLLYLGFIGLVVPFGYAVAHLIVGRVDRSWVAATRGWILLAWICLTAGIVFGAWWSYAVLGWGGYWAWDPVENASLLPWLTTTALVHSALRRRSRAASPLWDVTLAATGFLLVAAGTFLTRSGVVTSVHSFTRSQLGPALLGLLACWAVAVVGLLIWRADTLAPTRPDERGPAWAGGRGTPLLLNNLLLVGLAVTVLTGTLLPVLCEALTGTQLSVGSPYYDRIAVPMGLMLLGSLVWGTVSRWRREPDAVVVRRAAPPLAVAAVVVAALGLAGARGLAPVLALGLAAAVATAASHEIATVLRSGPGWPGRIWHRRRAVGGHLTHLGLAVAACGLAASSAWAASAEASVPVGGSLRAGGARAQLVGVDRQGSADRMATTARVRLSAPGRAVRGGAPALVYYPGRDETVTVPSISGDWRGDVYVTVLAVSQDGSGATLRLADEPLVGWIWAGAAVMVLGGAAALGPARRTGRRPAGPGGPGGPGGQVAERAAPAPEGVG